MTQNVEDPLWALYFVCHSGSEFIKKTGSAQMIRYGAQQTG